MEAVLRQEKFDQEPIGSTASSYELERNKRLERNRNFLRQIWFETLGTSPAPLPVPKVSEQELKSRGEICVSVSLRRNDSMKKSKNARKLAETKVLSTPQKPVRRSERKRFRAMNGAEYVPGASDNDSQNGGLIETEEHTEAVEGEHSAVKLDELYDMERYFSEIAPRSPHAPEPLRVDGHFRGWVDPQVAMRWGIASNSTDAWSTNGGGRFSYRNPLGTIGTGTRKVQLTAKEIARRSLQKNPNAYFYRHNEPGEEQWFGDWSPAEIERFVEVARLFGCGDKWGLFASYIPHRVGYQCSSAYREIILPSGMIFDPNYAMTYNGKAIYIGKHWGVPNQLAPKL
ncbi:hypothetical protein CCYA_CCYA18G4542 [Cyanidiococcus yangmingshanensis]|nr:hypothetical protein CCYA_CCYA18G4542 [Cyanidiococcus yangmingshanensis]